MCDLQRRSGARLTRRERERRAYQLTLATGALTAVAVVGAVLAVFLDIGTGSIAVIAAVLAVVCFLMLRRTLGR